MPETAEIHSFKKPGGGRGRPAPDSKCEICHIVWTEHPRIPIADRKIAATPRKEKPIHSKLIHNTQIIRPKPIKPQIIHNTQVIESQSGLESQSEPQISPEELLTQKLLLEEKRLQDKKRATARIEKLLTFMRNKWIDDQIKQYPDRGNREYWELKHEEECNANW